MIEQAMHPSIHLQVFPHIQFKLPSNGIALEKEKKAKRTKN